MQKYLQKIFPTQTTKFVVNKSCSQIIEQLKKDTVGGIAFIPKAAIFYGRINQKDFRITPVTFNFTRNSRCRVYGNITEFADGTSEVEVNYYVDNGGIIIYLFLITVLIMSSIINLKFGFMFSGIIILTFIFVPIIYLTHLHAITRSKPVIDNYFNNL